MILIKFDGIQGDAQVEGHVGEVVADSWSWGVAGGPSSEFGDFVFSHAYDRASPLFAKRCAQRAVIKTALVSFVETSTDSQGNTRTQTYLKIALYEVNVAGYEVSGDADGRPSDKVTLSYQRIATSYSVFDPSGTKVVDTVDFGWDVAAGKSFSVPL